MENKKESNLLGTEKWDLLTKIILGVSVILILFSFLAPLIFTQTAIYSSLNFTNTGAIGDTLGGIMNPFIALVGVLLTFLAFYMQFKANQLQRELFIEALELEKQKESDAEKKKHLTRLKVIKALLNSMIKYYKLSGNQLNNYYKLEEKQPLKTNIFNSSTSSSYNNFLKLDLLETYKSLAFYFSDKNIDWEKDFVQVLDYLDFYDKMILELRNKYHDHVNKKFIALSQSGEKLNSIMNDVFTHKDLKDLKINQIYLDLTQSETDIKLLREKFLIPLLQEIYSLYKEKEYLDYKIFLNDLSEVNKKIGGEELQSLNHADNFKSYYDSYFKEDNEFIKKIEDFNNLIEV
jgi:hypothetical protein